MKLEVISYFNVQKRTADGYYLVQDNWNDYGFSTTYILWVIHDGKKEKIGDVKIADKRYSDSKSAYKGIDQKILNDQTRKQYISLGSLEYYSNLLKLPSYEREKILELLQDLALNLDLLNEYKDYPVVSISFLRGIKLSDVKSRYHRLAKGKKQIKYNIKVAKKDNSRFELNMNMDSEATIPNNIHALIGNNGSGKTKTLQGVASSCEGQLKAPINLSSKTKSADGIFRASVDHKTDLHIDTALESIIYISYSPFDNHQNIEELTKNKNVKFIGILDQDKSTSKSINSRMNDELYALLKLKNSASKEDKSIPATKSKLMMWNNMVKNLMFDDGIKSLSDDLIIKIDEAGNTSEISREVIEKLSSGQKILLLSFANLIVEAVERTFIIIDEPELFLHPPLVTTYIRELSRIIQKTDSICLVATHSPFIVQELPRECVHMLSRHGDETIVSQASTQTFGENIARINNNIFGTDMRQTGFYNFLSQLAEEDKEKAKMLLEGKELGLVAQVTLKSHLENKKHIQNKDKEE